MAKRSNTGSNTDDSNKNKSKKSKKITGAEVLANIDKYVKNPSAIVAKYQNDLEELGVFDKVSKGGIAVMIEFIKPKDVIEEAFKNAKNGKVYR